MPSKQSKRPRTVALPVPPQAPAPAPSPVILFLEKHAPWLVLAFILIASARIVATYTVFNHTFDEPAHLACGMEWLDKGVYRWEPQHPPLARVAGALGPYLSGIRSQGTPKTDEFSMSWEGVAILDSQHHYDRTLFLARLGILPFFWVGCVVVYLWGKRYFNPVVAVVAVFLFSFLPPVLAHAGLATTDMALTAFFGAAFFAGIVWLETPTTKHAIWFGVTMGLAISSKFSILVFFPASVAAALAWYGITEWHGFSWLTAEARKRLPSFGLAVLVACILIWTVYRFSFGKVDFANISLPAPELYRGIQDVMKHNAEGHPGFLLGQRGRTGFWYFYPVVIAVKTPLAFLILLAFGTFLVLWKSRYPRAWIPLAFAAGILAVGVFSRINIGIRHVLPIYTAFSLVAALAAVNLLENTKARKWFPIALGVLVLWLAASSLLSHPDYLPYFNELAGSHPEDIVVDSDLDWGQDMKRLGNRLREAHAQEVVFVPLLLAHLESEFGFPHVIDKMDVTKPTPGWTAVGLTGLRQRRLGLWDSYPNLTVWPDRYEPTERVGKSIWLWYFPPAAP